LHATPTEFANSDLLPCYRDASRLSNLIASRPADFRLHAYSPGINRRRYTGRQRRNYPAGLIILSPTLHFTRQLQLFADFGDACISRRIISRHLISSRRVLAISRQYFPRRRDTDEINSQPRQDGASLDKHHSSSMRHEIIYATSPTVSSGPCLYSLTLCSAFPSLPPCRISSIT